MFSFLAKKNTINYGLRKHETFMLFQQETKYTNKKFFIKNSIKQNNHWLQILLEWFVLNIFYPLIHKKVQG